MSGKASSGGGPPSRTLRQRLNRLVREYLVFHGYELTSEMFDKEASAKSAASEDEVYPTSSKIQSKDDFLAAFDRGRHNELFNLWEQFIPPHIRKTDPTAQKLEFYLNIFFAIYPLLINQPDSFPPAVSRFRVYLESRGHELAQTQEFLAFYALPYIPNPTEHPSFKALFTDDWAQDLRARLDRFLSLTLNDSRPEIYGVFEVYTARLGESNGTLPVRDLGGSTEQVEELAGRLREMERREFDLKQNFLARHEKLQTTFQDLLQVAAELTTTLQGAQRGDTISDSYVQDVRKQLAGYIAAGRLTAKTTGGQRPPSGPRSAQTRISGRGSRPGSTGQKRQPMTPPRSSDSRGTQRGASARGGDQLPPSSRGGVSASGRRDDPPPIPTPRHLAPLDYGKIREDLRSSDALDRTLLLQALRWRYTRTRAGRARRLVLSAYCDQDVLDAGKPEGLIATLLDKKDPLVCEYTARLINTLASEASGRSYLLRSKAIVGVLVNVLTKSESDDTTTRQNVLGALQKLSLRRQPQTAMIDQDLIKWLCSILKDSDMLSEYTMEYGTALLMNLCLRHSGKIKCEDPELDVLTVLSDLLDNDSTQVRNYVNGALYSVLSRSVIRERARAMGLEEILKSLIKSSDPTIKKQLNFILQQLSSDADTRPDNEDSDYEDDDDDDDDDDDEFDDSDGEDDEVEEETLDPSTVNRPQGEELLCSKYLVHDGEAAMQQTQKGDEAEEQRRERQAARPPSSGAPRGTGNEDEPLRRPTTPAGGLTPRQYDPNTDPMAAAPRLARTPAAGQARVYQPPPQNRSPSPPPVDSVRSTKVSFAGDTKKSNDGDAPKDPAAASGATSGTTSIDARSAQSTRSAQGAEEPAATDDPDLEAFAPRSKIPRTPATGNKPSPPAGRGKGKGKSKRGKGKGRA